MINKGKWALWLLLMIFIVAVLTVADETFIKYGARPWLYEVDDTIYFNESYLNISLPSNCSGVGSCVNVAYMNYDNIGNFSILSNLNISGLYITKNDTAYKLIPSEGMDICIGATC